MLALFPINFGITMIIRRWQVQQMHYKDERTKMVNEVLNGIKASTSKQPVPFLRRSLLTRSNWKFKKK